MRRLFIVNMQMFVIHLDPCAQKAVENKQRAEEPPLGVVMALLGTSQLLEVEEEISSKFSNHTQKATITVALLNVPESGCFRKVSDVGEKLLFLLVIFVCLFR